MAERKYEKYIVTDLKLPEATRQLDEKIKYNDRATRIAWLNDEIIEGAFHINISWYWKATEEVGSPAHTHDFDEILGFIGSDPDNPGDLCGEVEFWLEDEQYFLTRSCLIFAPAGMKHCPLRVTRVERPILFIATGLSGSYYKLFDKDNPGWT
jgi:hypothetical protein